MITEIKKGDKFVCVKPTEHAISIFGKVYTSDVANTLQLEPLNFVTLDSGSQEGIELFNQHFIPYTFKALADYYRNIDKNENAKPFSDLLGNFYSYTTGESKNETIGDCQGNCTSCQCDPDVQHELEKEGIEHHVLDGEAGERIARDILKGSERCIKDMEDITGLKLTCPSSQAKVGDCIRCVKKLCPTGETRSFGVGGYNQILDIHNDVYYLTNEVFVSIKELDEHFVIDNSVVRDILENTPTPDVQLPPYYNNDNGSLYKIAEQRGWNAYQFEIVKRIDRSLKKGEFRSDLEKTKSVIDLWISESADDVNNQIEILNKKP